MKWVHPIRWTTRKKAALLEAIAQSIYEQENFEYNETATVSQNISSDLYDKIDEENNNTKFLGAAKFFGIMLASFLELTSDVYSNTNVAIEDNKILKLIADFIEFEDLEFLIMPVFKSGNIISLDWMLLESDGMCINYYYMEVEYDPETLEAVTYEILGMFGILKSNGEYYFAGSTEYVDEEWKPFEQKFEEKVADENNIFIPDTDIRDSINRMTSIIEKAAGDYGIIDN